jgi:hypothetical protein
MEFKFEHKAYEKGNKDVQKKERKIKWEKMDKELLNFNWPSLMNSRK